MKHNFIALSFVAAALFAGCAKENIVEESTPEEVKYVELKLNASYAETKSGLGADAHSVEWKKDDAVSVFINGTNYKFTADEGGTSVPFTCSQVNQSDAESTGTIYAAYPYSAGYKLDGGKISGIEIPAVQKLTEGSYDPEASVSVANGTIKGGLSFKNVCTLVKVHLTESKAIRGAQLTCPSGFALAGKGIAVNTESAAITFPANYAGCTNTVNLINNDKAGVTGQDFYMAVAPNSSTGDFKLSVFNADEKFYSKAFTTTKAFENSKIVTVNEADGAEYKDAYIHYGTANCICLYGVSKDNTITVDATPYIASDSFIATGLISYSTSMPVAGNMWRETMFKGLSYKSVAKNASVDGKLDLKVKRSKDETDSDKFGNMTFTLLSGTEIVWSYHVWSPEDNPEAILEHNGYEVMSMALGAINSKYTKDMDLSRLAGCFYQWGRKDPMGRRDFSAADATNPYVECKGTAITVKSIGADADVVSYSVKNPTVIISDNTSSKNNSLWANPAGYNSPKIVSKSIYDPCPEGYMVAPSDVYDNVVTAGNVKNTISGTALDYEEEFARYNGFMFGDDLVSASGFRKKDGTFSGDGAAHYWTSTFKSEKSAYPYKIYFGKDTKGAWQFNAKSGGGDNAQACCVRCVRVK